MVAKGELAVRSQKLLASRSQELPGDVLALLEELASGDYVSARKLAGVKELADLFQVGRTTVSNWGSPLRNLNFPKPMTELGGGPVYDAHEVMEWWKAWVPSKGRKSGQPPLWLLDH